MNYKDACLIAEDLKTLIQPACEPESVMIGGGIRRKKMDVHDIEIIAKPILKPPVPVFGDPRTFLTPLDKKLYELEMAKRLYSTSPNKGEKKKVYKINLDYYGLQALNGFSVEFYLCTPPAQWGVGIVIRTGPGSDEDNFSKFCVTQRLQGGALPDGYRVRHLAVWSADQLDARFEPFKGESPMEMPEEMDFLKFLGLGWIEPAARHAGWKTR